ncbi:hypothetical protein G6F24_016070 [Rhizopus arrhizus]|nr:hypothetical protein G6F24_016070 [Rhizopus arrhizus]
MWTSPSASGCPASQTSEWEGERFGVSDQADRYRAVTFGVPPDGKKGDARPLQRPGTYWEYNDVRINQLSYALLHLFRKPLPDVFREAVTRPSGAREDWQWVGYDTAWVEIDGQRMPSVPGGSHWGGGMPMASRSCRGNGFKRCARPAPSRRITAT